MFRPMPQDVISRIGRRILAVIALGIALVAVFSDETTLGHIGIVMGVFGWIAFVILCGIDHFWGDKIKRRKVDIPDDPGDGTIYAEMSAANPAIEIPVTRLRRQ